MTLRLTDEQDAALERLAARQQVSKQEAAVRAIQSASERMDVAGGVKDWTDHALVRYESLLDRLAQ